MQLTFMVDPEVWQVHPDRIKLTFRVDPEVQQVHPDTDSPRYRGQMPVGHDNNQAWAFGGRDVWVQYEFGGSGTVPYATTWVDR